MAITQLSAVKNLPYLASNALALVTVLPLGIAVLVFLNVFKGVLKSWMLIGTGMISYEIYLVHAFTLGLVKGSLFWISVFVVTTAVLAMLLHFALKLLDVKKQKAKYVM
mgnify:CR=1 FL=1